VHREQSVKRERERKPTRCNNQKFITNFCLNMFRASLCPSSGEQRQCVTAYGVLRWFCWMWLVAVVGRCVVGCETQCSCSPEDGHNDARNMLGQKLIINIWLLHLVGFLSLHSKSFFLRFWLPGIGHYQKLKKKIYPGQNRQVSPPPVI